ncbi:alpha-glucan phosphorylase [Thermus scotoductus]|uniref:glycogen phosphorylase n=1 Tax=Thermus scotoductus TaxID=37636 RepID=A0A430S6D9_THESC|nr:alpha-glucan family phosphorylase [Thermus scotoductus]RTG96209.1 alpha-glucan phosphorylase [Thermus scotoductus]RTH05734.1 alpha-glucan phosphorylase [Thermus scotoductus]RTH10498.1 alpha-glucan phosphorylase [Thermus scotoductus]RTH11728.1 alpha-glucan phosphorylase [Thermus scotoductus]RTH18450.1 alpha-glucan phosphorylase [Thermus scotoductus]
MKVLGRLTAMPELPEALRGLRKLAYNLWWSWNPEAAELFQEINPLLWKRFRGNPVKLLLEVDPPRLEALTHGSYPARVQAVVAALEAYLKEREVKQGPLTAYFSAEYGFHSSLPIYAGGLGVLAGDHIKAASDLGLNLVGVGIFYHEGYFHQRLSPEGAQVEVYETLHPEELPLLPVQDQEGRPLRVGIEFPGRTVWLGAYRVQVGAVPVYLLTADLPENTPEDRAITARLYAPGLEMRIQQEMVLGIGGVRLLRALGLNPQVFHMNEGHSAFLGLERVRELVAEGHPFPVALELARAGALFTTHTPVPAGHDTFPLELVERYLLGFWEKLSVDKEGFFALGLEEKPWGKVFSMSNLALRTSAQAGGVSRLHGEVSREMFHHLWPELLREEVPIGHITNGVHTWTFLHPRLRRHYAEVFGPDWLRHPEDPATWRVEGLGEEFWRIHRDLRAELVREVRSRLYEQRRRNGESPSRLRQAERILDPEALTVGFARRFATYKRAVLLFKDPERLLRILQGPYPVQFVFAGKAHPKDEPGKAYLQELVARIKEYGLEDRMVVLEDYDMYLARVLVHGSDVWLNTPRRPMEASGTSGMKAALNGVLNLSVLDGWWAEAYNGKNGFAIGDERVYENEEAQDMADAQALYDVLEGEVLHLFYATGPEGYSSGWLSMVHESLRTVGPRFSAARMVREYLALYQRGQEWAGKARGEEEVLRAFHQALPAFYGLALRVEVPGDLTLNGEPLRARAYLEGEVPEALRPFLEVQLVVRRAGGGLEVVPMEEASGWFEVAYRPSRPGSYAYGVRMALRHPVTGRVEWVRWA